MGMGRGMGMGMGMGVRMHLRMRLELGPAGQVFPIQWHLLRGLGVLIPALRLRSLLSELSPVQLAMINSLQLCPCHRCLLRRQILLLRQATSFFFFLFVTPHRVAKWRKK